jgi:hypothetical protein
VENLEKEVAAASQLRMQVDLLQAEVDRLAGRQPVAEAPHAEEAYVPTESPLAFEPLAAAGGCTGGSGCTGCPHCMGHDGDGLAGNSLVGSYNYNFGGGYLQLQSRDEDFTFQIQNQLTLDGTFYSLDNANTFEKGFNVPFYRLYFMGNFLEQWEYLASVQQSLGSFNILDVYAQHSRGPLPQPVSLRILGILAGLGAGDHQLAALPAGWQASDRSHAVGPAVRQRRAVSGGRV